MIFFVLTEITLPTYRRKSGYMKGNMVAITTTYAQKSWIKVYLIIGKFIFLGGMSLSRKIIPAHLPRGSAVRRPGRPGPGTRKIREKLKKKIVE